MPIALLPPPTQAMTASGSRPVCSRICARASSPITDWKSRTISRVRMRPERGAEHVMRVVGRRHPVAHRFVDRVLERAAPGVDARHVCAEQLACGRRSAPAAACPPRPCRPRTRARAARTPWRVATPCWPAPVSAMMRVLPIRLASSACPSALLILCAPVCIRSSRFRKMRAPPQASLSRFASHNGVGRPAYCVSRRVSSAANVASCRAAR